MSEFESDLDDINDDVIEICVESLVGTIFEMRLSKYETIGSIKSRLHRLEGIPKSQMHLLYLGKELEDAPSLFEYQIESGSTLKLILALRGGPINTRRIPVPQSAMGQSVDPERVPRDIRELMAKNRAQLLDKMPKNGQVTVLLFREGDQVNLYHVLEKADGSYSPLSDSWSENSAKNLFVKDDPGLDKDALEERLKMNALTMNKMTDLRLQLQNLHMKKEKRKRRRKTGTRSTASNSASSRLNNNINNQYPPPTNGKIAGHASPHGSITESQQRRRPRSTTKRGERVKTARRDSVHVKQPQENVLQEGMEVHYSVPLPPIHTSNQKTDLRMDDLDLSSTTTSIQPLQGFGTGTQSNKPVNTTTNNNNNNNCSSQSQIVNQARQRSLSRQSSLSTTLPMMRNNPIRTVPEWLQKNESQLGLSQRSSAPLPSTMDDNIFNRDIDVIDLKLDPDDPNVEIVRRRRTQKLITTDINNLNNFDQVKGSMAVRPRPKKGSAVASMSGAEDDIFVPDVPMTATPDFLARSGSSLKKSSRNWSGRTSSKLSKRSASGLSAKNGPTFTTGRPGSSSAKGRKRKKTPRPRCSEGSCRKKLNITNGFPCSCQGLFCAKHRHPELHGCTFDFKTEGRKILERENPIVVLPKLPKI